MIESVNNNNEKVRTKNVPPMITAGDQVTTKDI